MLELLDVSVTIGKKAILRDATLSAYPGEILGLIGPNGAGKSTVLKTVSGLLRQSGGNIQWQGLPVSSYPLCHMAKWRAVMTQSVTISNNFSVEEVIMMGRYPYFKNRPNIVDHSEVAQNMDLFGLTNFSGQQFNQLSGGEKQRVNFARVLSQLSFSTGNNDVPQLLLLDEPLNNLDIKHQYHCLQLALDFAQRGNVVVMVLHDINLALAYASRLALLKNGEILTTGPTSEIGTAQNFSDCYDLKATLHFDKYGSRVDFRPEATSLKFQRHL